MIECNKVYISGKITGDENYIEKFKKAQEILEEVGFTVLNPITYPEGLTHDEYMHLSYAMIDCADTVCMLKDWEDSKGAKLEYDYAIKTNKNIIGLVEKPILDFWDNVCKIQKKQIQKGLKKYGHILEENNMDILSGLQYLEEELVDALMYLELIKERLNELKSRNNK